MPNRDHVPGLAAAYGADVSELPPDTPKGKGGKSR
jgi:hypothetical protein